MDRTSDFYLTAGAEFDLLEEWRACRVIDRLRREAQRDDYMLVEIAPVLIGQYFGLGDRDISRLIISTRHLGYTLFPITEWPCHVYVARILDESILTTRIFNADQVEYIAKASLYSSPNFE